MIPRLTFHHLGLALRDDKNALLFLQRLGYMADERVYDPEQNVFVRLCAAPDQPAVEIVMPGGGRTPLDGILKNQSEMIYHTCYELKDIDVFIQGLQDAGLRPTCISPPKPALLFGGRAVSFYYIKNYGMIELLQAV